MMNFKREKQDNKVSFGTLNVGALFKYGDLDDDVCIKIIEGMDTADSDHFFNAIYLADGSDLYIGSLERVEPINSCTFSY